MISKQKALSLIDSFELEADDEISFEMLKDTNRRLRNKHIRNYKIRSACTALKNLGIILEGNFISARKRLSNINNIVKKDNSRSKKVDTKEFIRGKLEFVKIGLNRIALYSEK